MLGYKRYKYRSGFDYGKGVSRNLKYFGYKLVALSTLEGLPIVNEMVSAYFNERLGANTVINYLGNSQIFADNSFLGAVASYHLCPVP